MYKMFTAELFITVKNWKQPAHPTIRGRVSTPGSTHTIEVDTTINIYVFEDYFMEIANLPEPFPGRIISTLQVLTHFVSSKCKPYAGDVICIAPFDT